LTFVNAVDFIEVFTVMAFFFGNRTEESGPNNVNDGRLDAIRDKRYPLLGRMPTVEDIAGVFTFLGSEASKCMTGQVLCVNAGTTA
jgi:NAD(P)-dependent dehydrogenase (short-subunit alcohol dehydrogenase family)